MGVVVGPEVREFGVGPARGPARAALAARRARGGAVGVDARVEEEDAVAAVEEEALPARREEQVVLDDGEPRVREELVRARGRRGPVDVLRRLGDGVAVLVGFRAGLQEKGGVLLHVRRAEATRERRGERRFAHAARPDDADDEGPPRPLPAERAAGEVPSRLEGAHVAGGRAKAGEPRGAAQHRLARLRLRLHQPPPRGV